MRATQFLMVLTIELVAICNIASCFDHEVKPLCTPDKKICSFELSIEKRRTMTLYGRPKNSTLARDNARYILVRNGKLYKRNNDKCNSLELLTEKERQAAITTDGSYGFVYTINGQFPGPTLVVYHKQEVVIKVTNHLYQETFTIHWHGITQKQTNWMDGVPTVTQCAIGPEETFTYRFLAEPMGTHWYHSHQGAQRSDGMHGAFIVLPRSNQVHPPPQINDYVMTVQDWYTEDSNDLFHTFYSGLAYYDKFGLSNTEHCYEPSMQVDGTEIGPIPFQSSLINGRGYKQDDDLQQGLPLETFHVQHGGFYRFRLIHSGMLYSLKVSIDNHKLQVVATDGAEILPIHADAVILTSGERYDVIIHTNQTAASLYWIRVETLHWNLTTDKSEPKTVLGIIAYNSTNAKGLYPQTKPKQCSMYDQCVYVNCPYRFLPEQHFTKCKNREDLQTLEVVNLESAPHNLEQIFLNFHFSETIDGGARSTINGIQHVVPTSNTRLHSKDFVADCKHYDCDVKPCRCTHTLHVRSGVTVQMVFFSYVNITAEGIIGSSHPVHMHGHHFHIMKVGYPVYNKTTKRVIEMNKEIQCDNARCTSASWRSDAYRKGIIPGLNLINPPLKDTVHVPAGGYAIVRFVTDNPGFWMLHCHIENHNLEGMALVLREGDFPEMTSQPKHFAQCGSFDITHSEFQEAIDATNKWLKNKNILQWTGIGLAIIALNVIVCLVIMAITRSCKKKECARNLNTEVKTYRTPDADGTEDEVLQEKSPLLAETQIT